MTPEIAQYQHMIDDLRQQVIELLAGLPAEALNWRPLPQSDEHATNSLAVMAAHVAGAEHFWMAEVIGGHPPTRNRPAEFVTQADGADELIRRLQAVAEETRAVLSTLSEADLAGDRIAHGKSVPLRWCILHVIDHAALHLGHMQITYQLWMGGQSKDMPRWFERLPK
ncbi:MAG: DUF664 domain-containing protein [Caldilineales bacterium]|nr:DUF664 domain-containing protein [Caldilineales bacterium]